MIAQVLFALKGGSSPVSSPDAEERTDGFPKASPAFEGRDSSPWRRLAPGWNHYRGFRGCLWSGKKSTRESAHSARSQPNRCVRIANVLKKALVVLAQKTPQGLLTNRLWVRNLSEEVTVPSSVPSRFS